MFKIKKLYIENFKGIKESKVIDFEKSDKLQINILSGPNGYGKTTIFEAIELCLTGQLNRSYTFAGIQSSTRDMNKPNFQNTIGEDVVIKLWIQNNETNENHIIIKCFDKERSPDSVDGRRYKPIENMHFFFTHHTSDISFFDKINFKELVELKQDDLDKMILGTSYLSLPDLYYLFNYLQQEDNLYFLRKSESDKMNDLSFLFNNEKEQEKVNELNDLLNVLYERQNKINIEIDLLKETIMPSETIEYKRLFNENEFDFDSKNPFGMDISENKVKLDKYIEEIELVIDLKNSFSISDYEKYKNYERVNNEYINDNALLEAIVVHKIYSLELVDNLLLINDTINENNTFKTRQDKTKILEKYFNLYIDKEALLEYNKSISEIRIIDKELGIIGKIISDLNNAREKSVLEFNKIKSEPFIKDNNCPLCDNPFASYEELIKQVEKKTESLVSINKIKLDRKSVIVKTIESFSN